MTSLDALLNRLDALRDRYETDARKAIEAYAQSGQTAKTAILHPSKDIPTAKGTPAKARKPHWTKRPENAAKARAWKRAMAKANKHGRS